MNWQKTNEIQKKKKIKRSENWTKGEKKEEALELYWDTCTILICVNFLLIAFLMFPETSPVFPYRRRFSGYRENIIHENLSALTQPKSYLLGWVLL